MSDWDELSPLEIDNQRLRAERDAEREACLQYKRECEIAYADISDGNKARDKLRAELAAERMRYMETLDELDACCAERTKLRAELAAERERYAFLAETNENLRRSMETNIQFWRSSERDTLRSALVKAGEALEFYENKQVYEPDSVGRLPDLTFRARAALDEIRKLTGGEDGASK